MLDILLAPAQSNPGWDLIKILSSYYGLKDYLQMRYVEKFQQKRVRKIPAYTKGTYVSGEEIFWKEISTGSLIEGQVIRLSDFQISPWFPRKPGMYWTYSAALARKKAHKHHIDRVHGDIVIFDLYGKTLMTELGGIGCVNFRKDRDEVLVTATASGYTERGIPLVCPRPIWQTIEAELMKHVMIEVDLIGTIEPIPMNYDSYILRSPNIPKLGVSIDSILNIKFKMSDRSIVVTPWTVFELADPYQPYGFTYVTHELFHRDLQRSVDWMMDYIDENRGKAIITDFDEELNQLNAQFPLSGCLNGDITSNDLLRFCQRIKRSFDKLNG